MSGEWVTEMLAEDWSKELLEEVGLDDILADIIRGEEKDKELDEEKPLNAADELNKKWKVENGDLWLIGKNRLICGDSTNSDVVDRLMNGEKWSLMPTDPPYGVSVVGGTHDPRDKSNYKSGSSIANDELTGEDLEKLISQSFSVAANHGSPGASWYCWYAGSQTRAVLDACERLGGMRHVLVWVKQNFVFGRCDYHYRHEPVMYGWLPGGSHRWYGDRKQDSVWECDAVGTDLDKKQHPTSKPVELASKPIRNHTEVGDVVYDPFLGSGTTMVAAQHLDRVCFGVELSPSFCAVILERMSNAFAGIKIEKLDK
jgi:DNA modification methylase